MKEDEGRYNLSSFGYVLVSHQDFKMVEELGVTD